MTSNNVAAAAAPWNAGDYARNSSLQETMAGEVLALLHLNGDERMLDIGCGDGRLTARIAERLPRGRILGVDASKDMVEFAAAHWAAGANGKLRFEVADAAALAFDAEFDRIVSFNALHWVPAQAEALDGIRAALANGGRAQLRMVVKGPVGSLEELAEAVRQTEAWRAHFEGFVDPYLRLDSDAYAALAAARGFEVVACSTRLHAWDFRTDEAFLGFCKAGFGAWTRRLPAERQDDFVREVIAAYREAHAATAGERNVFRFYQMDIELA